MEQAEIMNRQFWEWLTASAMTFGIRSLTGLLVLGVFWLLGNGLQRLTLRIGASRDLDADLMQILARSAKTTLLVFGTITALGTLGIDVSALVAGLGLTGFALGFALKDIISNTLAGILIIIYKPFRRHNVVSYAAFTGTVREINLRYTVLDADGKKVFVPNSLLFTNAITVEPGQLDGEATSNAIPTA